MRGVAAAALAALLAGAAPASAGDFKPFSLTAQDGKPRTLADVAGTATLVVFFFPSCRYCSAARPAMEELHAEWRERGLRLVWINILPEEEKNIPAWIEKHGVTVPVLSGEKQRKLERDYRLRMAPTMVLVGVDGRELYRKAGYKAGDEQELEEAVRRALGATT